MIINNMNSIKKFYFFEKIFKIIFSLDNKLMFTSVQPLMYPAKTSYKNILINTFFFLSNLNIKDFIKTLILLIFFLFIDILKILYLPIIIFFYFSKYRFVQLQYNQIGASTQHLNIMVKKNFIDGYKSIILMPSTTEFSFFSEIFENLIIVNNLFLNVLLMPLKHTNFISCTTKKVEHHLNSNLKLVHSSPFSKITNRFKKKNKEKTKNIFKFKDKYVKENYNYFKKKYPHVDLKKTIIIHHRERNYKKTSHLRGSLISTYKPSIRYLLSKGFVVIRLIHSRSTKLFFKNKKYIEINMEELVNKKLQFLILKKCKGFIATDSGPNSIGSLLDMPVYNTNVYGINVNAINKSGVYILKKIKRLNKTLTYKELIDLGYYKGFCYSRRYAEKIGLSPIDNSAEEILLGLKEFIKLNNKYKPNKKQINFKNSLPDYIELKHYDSNISNAFIKKNETLFKELI